MRPNTPLPSGLPHRRPGAKRIPPSARAGRIAPPPARQGRSGIRAMPSAFACREPCRHRDRGGGLPLLGRPEHPGIAATPTATGAFLGLSRRLPLRRPPVAKHQVAQRIARGESKLALVVGLVMVAHAIRVGRAVSAIAVASHLPDRQASNVWRGSTPKPASSRTGSAGIRLLATLPIGDHESGCRYPLRSR